MISGITVAFLYSSYYSFFLILAIPLILGAWILKEYYSKCNTLEEHKHLLKAEISVKASFENIDTVKIYSQEINEIFNFQNLSTQFQKQENKYCVTTSFLDGAFEMSHFLCIGLSLYAAQIFLFDDVSVNFRKY